jgi:6-phosphogluconolactonase (cycloisomerase 2 family)
MSTMRLLLSKSLLLAALAAANSLAAQTFQLVMCDTPVNTGSYQPVERFVVGGTNGPLTAISSIPANLTNDPTFPAFNNQYELFISNRHGHAQGSVSRFTFDPSFGVFNPNGTITGNGLLDCTQLVFNPLDGELFVGNYTNRTVSRFRFDAQGNAVANGTLTMPDTSVIMGMAIRSADQQLFVGSQGFVRRFARQANGTYTYLGTFTIPGATLIHGLAFRGDELFVCDITTNQVYRFNFNASGVPVANGSVACSSPIACAFSPDGGEMFVARHFAGGMQRFLYAPATNSWTASTIRTGPGAGGIAATIHTFSA